MPPRRRPARLPRVLVSLLLVPVVLWAATAAATHLPSHRYYVQGQVVHPDGSPACGVTVEAAKEGFAFVSAQTDHTGRYRILLHLHNAEAAAADPGLANDEGATIVVRVPATDRVQTTTAQPGPSDDGWGESRADFTVPAGFGGACTDPVAQATLYLGVPLGVVAGLSVAYLKVLRPWWVRRSIAPTLTSLTGIGKSREQELNAMGIAGLEDLAEAQPARIARETSIGKKEARRLIRRARETLKRARDQG